MQDFFLSLFIKTTHAQGPATPVPTGRQVIVGEGGLNFAIPTFSDLLTFAIRGFFTAAGLAALFFLLQGAFNWVTSGGEKGKVEEAQKRMSAAVIGVVMIVVALAIVWTMEQIVFGGKICFGLSCAVTIPSLLKDPS